MRRKNILPALAIILAVAAAFIAGWHFGTQNPEKDRQAQINRIQKEIKEEIKEETKEETKKETRVAYTILKELKEAENSLKMTYDEREKRKLEIIMERIPGEKKEYKKDPKNFHKRWELMPDYSKITEKIKKENDSLKKEADKETDIHKRKEITDKITTFKYEKEKREIDIEHRKRMNQNILREIYKGTPEIEEKYNKKIDSLSKRIKYLEEESKNAKR
jgi:hypothetical protein